MTDWRVDYFIALHRMQLTITTELLNTLWSNLVVENLLEISPPITGHTSAHALGLILVPI
jgi:hypothetical protein